MEEIGCVLQVQVQFLPGYSVSTLVWINDVYRCVSAERVTSLGKDWHRPCLKCEKCNKTLSAGSHAEVSFRKYVAIPFPNRAEMLTFGKQTPDINTSWGYTVRVLCTLFKSIYVLWTDKCVLHHSMKGSPIVTTHATLRSLDPKVSHQSTMCHGWLLCFTVLYGYPFTKVSYDEF